MTIEEFPHNPQTESFLAAVDNADASIDVFFSFSLRAMATMVEILNGQVVAANAEMQAASRLNHGRRWDAFGDMAGALNEIWPRGF